MAVAALVTQPAAARDGAFNWTPIIQQVMEQPPASRPDLVNRVVNEDFDYHPDPSVWQTPDQLALRRAGDCKDLAFTKYWLLTKMGLPRVRMRLGFTDWTPPAGGPVQKHMVVLLWNDSGSPWVLDNLVHYIRRASDRPDLTVLFSFDERHFYLADSPQVVTDKRLKGWATLKAMIAEASEPLTATGGPSGSTVATIKKH